MSKFGIIRTVYNILSTTTKIYQTVLPTKNVQNKLCIKKTQTFEKLTIRFLQWLNPNSPKQLKIYPYLNLKHPIQLVCSSSSNEKISKFVILSNGTMPNTLII